MINIHIDNIGNLYDGNTCNVDGMTKCELDANGKAYTYYNLDGTPDTVKIEAKEKEDMLTKNNTEARAYLASTDWYVSRYTETGEDIPSGITLLRKEAREKVINPTIVKV